MSKNYVNSFKSGSLPPKRIVSLVPSLTELLFNLGLEEEVAGITKFCAHPEKWIRTKQRIGGTKTVNIAAVKRLHPDLIIANKEENVKEQVEELQKTGPVWVSDINTLKDALEMITMAGMLVHKQDKAGELATQIKNAFEQLIPLDEKLRTAYFIWKNPYMAAAGGTFIDDMLDRCGFENVFKSARRYPETTINDLLSANCHLLLLSSEPYPFAEKHISALQSQLPDCKIMLVDGEMFSWYGSRLLLAATYFQSLINEIRANPLHLIQ